MVDVEELERWIDGERTEVRYYNGRGGLLERREEEDGMKGEALAFCLAGAWRERAGVMVG